MTAAVAAREDRLAGREYGDVVAAVAPELAELFADGPVDAVVTLVGLAELAVRRAAFHKHTEPVREVRRLVRSFAGKYGVDLPADADVST